MVEGQHHQDGGVDRPDTSLGHPIPILPINLKTADRPQQVHQEYHKVKPTKTDQYARCEIGMRIQH